MTELVKVGVPEDLIVDGRRAYLPHPIFQSTLFAATRARRDGEYRKDTPTTVVHVNKFGDKLTVFAPRTLFVSPDMGVFLATVACAQKGGVHMLMDPVTNKLVEVSMVEFPLSWLYDLTGMASNGKGWYQLRSSLEALAYVSIAIHRDAESIRNDRKYKSRFLSYSVSHLWSVNIETRKGCKGSIVRLYPSSLLVPDKTSLWADAELCNKLRKDTAKGIFWQLICREHLTGTAEEWRKWINAGEEREVKVWKSRCLMPALEELAEYGYQVKENGDEITVKRPGAEKKRLPKPKPKDK